jgi:hypothetical protein
MYSLKCCTCMCISCHCMLVTSVLWDTDLEFKIFVEFLALQITVLLQVAYLSISIVYDSYTAPFSLEIVPFTFPVGPSCSYVFIICSSMSKLW